MYPLKNLENSSRNPSNFLSEIVINIAVGFIDLYRCMFSGFLSGVFGLRCRFYPSCSQYARLTIKREGLVVGSFLALKRLLKCHPYSGSDCED